MTEKNDPLTTTDAASDPIKTQSDPVSLIQRQYQREVDYIRAQQIAKSMYESKLISLSQFTKLTKLNKQSFSPIFTVFSSVIS